MVILPRKLVGREATLLPAPPRPRRAVLLALPLLAPLFSSLLLGGAAGDPVPIGDPVPVFLGTDRSFLKADLNVEYAGFTDTPPCEDRPQGTPDKNVCAADAETGLSLSGVRLTKPGVGHARAGVGLRYALVERCQGQAAQMAQFPMRVGFAYSRALGVDEPDTPGAGSAEATIWAFGHEGRGPESTPLPGEPVPWVEKVDADHASVQSRTALRIGNPPTLAGPHTALLYAHTTATLAVPGSVSEAGVVAELTRIDLDWQELGNPWTADSFTTPPGSPPVFDDSPGDWKWFKSPATLWLDAEDNFACPRYVHVRVDGGAFEAFPIEFAKDPVGVPRSEDGAWTVDFHAEDWQGNREPTETVRFGIDRVLPSLFVNLTPSAPDGLAGWYRTKPSARLECADGTSGCWKGEWKVTGGSTTQFPSFPRTTGALVEGVFSFTCKGWDNADNLATCNVPLKVDVRAPTLKAFCTPTGQPRAECGGTSHWYNRSLLIDLVCTDNAGGSGCGPLQYTLDGGALQNYTGSFPFSEDDEHTLVVMGADVAGNPAVAVEYGLNLDLTPPAAPALREDMGNDEQDVLVQTATWHWEASDDITSPAALRYRLTFEADGGPPTTIWPHLTTSYPLPGGMDGHDCLTVRAVDIAGNEGPPSIRLCRFVDGTPPTVTLPRPLPGEIYIGETRAATIAGQPAVLLGAFTFHSTARDLPPPGRTWTSGIAQHFTEMGQSVWTPHASSEANPCVDEDGDGVCEQMFAPSLCEMPTAGFFSTTFRVLAGDRAGNVPWTQTSVVFASLLATATTDASSGLPAMVVRWLPYDCGATFARYEVHRGVTGDFTPTPATKVATITDAGTTTWTDTGVVTETTYHYRVIAYAQEVVRATNSYPARHSGGGGGGGCLWKCTTMEVFIARGWEDEQPIWVT